MKKSIYIIAFSAVALLAVKTQAQSVTYRINKDDPYDIKNFSLAIDPLWIDANGQNGYSFGWGLRMDHMMGKILLVNADFRSAFGTNGYRISDKNTKNYFYFEGALGLIISHKTKTRNVPIILSSSSYSSGGYTYTRTLSIKGGVPAKIRSIVALRGGLYQMTNALSYNDKLLNDSILTFTNKNTGVERSLKDNKVVPDSMKFTIGEWGGISSTAIFAGFNFRNIRQLVVDVDGWGYRSNIMFQDFFIDGIFSPVTVIKNHTDSKSGDKLDVKYKSRNVFGWRMGWMFRKPKDQGFSWKFEFGRRPGLAAVENKSFVNFKNWYCMFTYGLYVPLKVKPIYRGENAD